MKKVLNIVSYPYLPSFSGGKKLIAHFNQYMGEQCVLHVAGTSDNDLSLVKNYTFHPVLKKGKIRYADLSSFFRLKKIIRQNQVNTIIVEHPYIGWLGLLLKKACNTRLIIHTHNIEHERFRTLGKSWWKLLKWYETFILKKADFVFCISEEDRQWMMQQMGLKKEKCILIPYGINQSAVPADKKECKEVVCKKHGLNPADALLFFNGLLDYKPNTDAVQTIIDKINPLLQQSSLSYTILIAGKNLPAQFNELKAWNNQHIIYAGFVDDIDLYSKAADILLNPVNSGGGVKTKMIEALGFNTSVVATETGATGVDRSTCGNKITIVADNDWQAFANAVSESINQESSTPKSFYQTYYWGNIVKKAADYFIPSEES